MTVVITKNIPQSPFSQSTNSPEEAANVVLPRVPIEASKAYWVAVYVLSTKSDINATKATVANAAAISSKRTATANSNSDFPDQASTANKRFVAAINIPEINIAFITPDRIANKPPSRVKMIVVTHPIPLE